MRALNCCHTLDLVLISPDAADNNCEQRRGESIIDSLIHQVVIENVDHLLRGIYCRMYTYNICKPCYYVCLLNICSCENKRVDFIAAVRA